MKAGWIVVALSAPVRSAFASESITLVGRAVCVDSQLFSALRNALPVDSKAL